jgi:hypothetical protein
MPIAAKEPKLENRVLKTSELATLLDVSTTTIHKLTQRGVLTSLTPIGRGAHDFGTYRLGPAVRAYLEWTLRDVPLSHAQFMKAALQIERERNMSAGYDDREATYAKRNG